MPTGIMEIWNARHALLFLVLLPAVLWNVEGQREKLEDWCWGYAVHTFCQLYNAENICEAQSGYNWTVLEWQSSLSLLRTAQQGKPDPCNPVGPNKGKIVSEHGPLPGWVMICYDCFLWPTKYVSFRWRLVLQMIFWMQGLKNIIPNFFQSLGAIPLSSAMSERHSETVYFYYEFAHTSQVTRHTRACKWRHNSVWCCVDCIWERKVCEPNRSPWFKSRNPNAAQHTSFWNIL